MEQLRKFLKTPAGRVTSVALLLIAGVALFLSLRDAMGANSVDSISRDRMYICAKTGKPFEYTIKLGDRIPVDSPHSDEKTGYPAELCYWTADGKPKSEPTPVLLNQYAGKQGPTFCPDCKRLVVGQNPPAAAGMTPPLTQEQYESRKEKR